MQNVSTQLLKQISLGKESVKVTTEGGGEWELSPQDAATVLDHVTTLPKGRKHDKDNMSSNRRLFDIIYKSALGKTPKREHKQAIEKAPEKSEG